MKTKDKRLNGLWTDGLLTKIHEPKTTTHNKSKFASNRNAHDNAGDKKIKAKENQRQ